MRPNTGNRLVLDDLDLSPGSKVSDDDLPDKAKRTIAAGATGLIFGRNTWQRPLAEALAITERIKDVLRQFPA